MKLKEALTYDDIQIVPNYSEIASRSDINTEVILDERRNYKLSVPIISSPMDTVTESQMAIELGKLGGLGIIHRFMSVDEQVKQINKVLKEGVLVGAAVGVNDIDKGRVSILMEETELPILNIDIAHGHCKKMKEMIKWVRVMYPDVHIMAGTVATGIGTKELIEWGADSIRCGVGNGCFTPDMEVITSEGNRQIKDIVMGDYVYTHTGELQEVVGKLEFDREEDLMVINGIKCTKNHKFCVVDREDRNKVTEDNIQHYVKWIPSEKLTKDYLLVELEG